MSQNQNLIPEDHHECSRWWQTHISAVNQTRQVEQADISLARSMTQPDNIGFEQGQIRPGDIGRWDVFYGFVPIATMNATGIMLLAGISAGEMAAAVQDMEYHNHGVNPEDREDVALYHRLKNMSPDELDREITRLEGLCSVGTLDEIDELDELNELEAEREVKRQDQRHEKEVYEFYFPRT